MAVAATIRGMARTVLAVDDDPFTIKALERYLRPEGIEVISASSGETGLARLEKGGVDLVVLDLNLPGIDGFETCSRIKGDESTRSIPVIMLTAAYVDSGNQQRGYEVGADAYMAKPFLRGALLGNVRALLDGKTERA